MSLNIVSSSFFGNGFYTASLLFIIFSIFIYWIIEREPSLRDKASREMYVCGNKADPDQYRVNEHSFYKTIINYFKLDIIKQAHSGKLSMYLLWVLFGLIIIGFILMWF
ncbi:MAG: hypothetical protein K0B02_01945 [DPANN group archaeon]|nr:hypothetical protein [DPANN group archaeon]